MNLKSKRFRNVLRALRRKRIRDDIDGCTVRNSNPNFDLVASDAMSGIVVDGRAYPYIPKGELWFDRRFIREKNFLLKVHAFEIATRRWKYSKTRARMKEILCRKGTPPSFVVRRMRHKGLSILYVRGDIVRQWIDPAFIFGGHDLVYRYIPEGEVWIDIRQDPREIPFTLAHELCERVLMSRGWSYNEAHRHATEVELILRQRPRVVRATEPLELKDMRQPLDGYCGITSLKIMCSFFGRDYDDRELEKLVRKQSGRRTSSEDYGADHAELVGAAEELGASVESGSGSLAAIARNLRKRRPVGVGWMTDDGDHFSVVYHLTKRHVYMMDPDSEEGGDRKMTIREFLERWHDTDTPKDIEVKRWYMAIDFKKGR